MVGVADRGIAVGGAADPGVADRDQGVEALAEPPGAGVHRGDIAADRVGEDPAQPAGVLGAEAFDRGADQVAGPAGRHRAVAVQVGGLVVGPEQGGVGDDQVDRNGDPVGGGLAGDALDQRVGHQLATGPRVAGRGPGVGVLLQGGVDRHPLGDGQQRTDACHRVGRRSAGDVAVGLGLAGAADCGAGVEPVRGTTGGGHHLRVAHAVQPDRVAAHLAVDLGAVLGRQQCGLAHHQLGSPLGQAAFLQRGQRERHLGHPGLGGTQAAAAPVRRLLASQCDLPGDAPALPLRGHPGGRLSGPLGSVELDADPRLRRSGTGLQLLQCADQVDPACVVEALTERGQLRVEGAHRRHCGRSLGVGGGGLHAPSLSNIRSIDKPIHLPMGRC